MSQQEFEQTDQEVISLVNGHSHPDAAAAAEEIADAAWEPAKEEDTCDCDVPDVDARYREEQEMCEKLYRKRKRAEVRQAVLFVIACLGIAAALLAAWYVPKLLIWVVNVGVLACGIAAAVKIDKYIRWWR